MDSVYLPLNRQNLSDDIAERITRLITGSGFESGTRLPAITTMARNFGVGAPTLREALKKLEAIGIVDIRHGSGVYVARSPEVMLVTNPVSGIAPTKKLLIDLIEARIPIEVMSAELAAERATPQQLLEMERLLDEANQSLGNATVLSEVNMSFHRHIALASGNVVVHHVLEVLSTLFRREQLHILDIHGRREEDHHEHREIYEALRLHDAALARTRMQDHLQRVRDMIALWTPPLQAAQEVHA
jgi:GntR family transcriptional repressor for pyruvate dehydrogenase complex